MKKPTLSEILPGAVVAGLFALILLLGMGRSLGNAAGTAGIIALAAIPALYFGRLAGYRRSGRR